MYILSFTWLLALIKRVLKVNASIVKRLVSYFLIIFSAIFDEDVLQDSFETFTRVLDFFWVT